MEEEKEEGPINVCEPFGYYIDTLKGFDSDISISRFDTEEEAKAHFDAIARGEEVKDATEDLGEKIDTLKNKIPERSPEEQVEIGALGFYELEKDKSLKEAKAYSEKNPGCIESKLCLIGWEEDSETRIDQLDALVEELPEGPLSITQLRARFELANELNRSNYADEALEEYHEILNLDTDNVFDVGIIISVELANKGKWLDLVKFFDQMDASINIIPSMVRAIAFFYKFGNKAKSKIALKDAYMVNEVPFKVLSGAMKSREEEDLDGLPDDADAVMAINILYDVMGRNDKLAKFVISNVMSWERDGM